MRSSLPLQEGTHHPVLFQSNEDGPGSDMAQCNLRVRVFYRKKSLKDFGSQYQCQHLCLVGLWTTANL